MRYEVTTGLTPPEALEQAATYFGPAGVGLQAVSQTLNGLVFQGGGGHVAITVHPGATTTLELETREWDAAVQKFMGQVSHRPRWWTRWRRRKRPATPPSPVFPIFNNTLDERVGREHVLGTEKQRSEKPA
jgi:hypothetical protein